MALVFLSTFACFKAALCAEKVSEPPFYAVDKEPPEVDLLKSRYKKNIDEGNRYFGMGLEREAKKLFWAAINIFPDIPDAYINLAVVHISENDLENALKFLENAAKLSKEDYYQREILFYNLGRCFFLKGDHTNATKSFQEAVRVYPDFGEALYCLGLSCEGDGRPEAAFINIFLAKYVFDEEAKFKYSKLAKQSLLDLKKEYTLDNPLLSKAFLEEAKEAFIDGNTDKALVLFKESIYLDPKNIEAYYEAALVYLRLRAYHNAVRYLNEIISLDPDNLKAHILLSRAYREQEKYKEASNILKKALEIDKEDPGIFYHMGLVYSDMGEIKAAKKFLLRARKMAHARNDTVLLDKIDYKYKKIKRHIPKKIVSDLYLKKKYVPKKAKVPEALYHKYWGNEGNLNAGYFLPLPTRKSQRVVY